MINRNTQGLTLITPRLQLQSPTLGMQPHHLALQPPSPVFHQHLFCHSGHSSLFWSCTFLSQVPSHPHVVCACEKMYEYMYAAEIEEGRKKGKRVYSFPLGSFKKEFRLQSNLHLILLGWPPAYIILHSCSAHMAQGELSLFYYRSGNLGPFSLPVVTACPWSCFMADFFFFHSFKHATKALLRAKLDGRVNVNGSLICYAKMFQTEYSFVKCLLVLFIMNKGKVLFQKAQQLTKPNNV